MSGKTGLLKADILHDGPQTTLKGIIIRGAWRDLHVVILNYTLLCSLSYLEMPCDVIFFLFLFELCKVFFLVSGQGTSERRGLFFVYYWKRDLLKDYENVYLWITLV